MAGTKLVNAFLKIRNSNFFNTLVISVIIASALYAIVDVMTKESRDGFMPDNEKTVK